MFKNYIAYLKDNPEGYWFKRKVYGWGWTPARWQGWAVLAVYLALFAYLFSKVDESARLGNDTLASFIAPLMVITAILFAVCYVKGEKPRWQWGIKK